MQFNLYKALLIIILLLSAYIAFSETKSSQTKTKQINNITDTTTDEKSSLKAGINYLSNNVFMGRTDSVRTAVISPEIKYTFASGIYLSGSLDIIPNRKKNKIDGGDITLGYEFNLTDDLSGGVSYSKPFYSSTSTQVSSAISSIFNGNLTYDIGDIISPTISADYNINKQGVAGDIFLNLGVTHDFSIDGLFDKKDKLSISPTIEINTGTQNFYDGYVVYRKQRNAKKDAAETKLIDAYTTQLSEYKVLDYEFSVPVEYQAGNFIFQFSPAYAAVQNQFQSAAVIKSLGLSGQTSVFYFNIGLALKF